MRLSRGVRLTYVAHVQMNGTGSNWFTPIMNNTVHGMINIILWVIFFFLIEELPYYIAAKKNDFDANQK